MSVGDVLGVGLGPSGEQPGGGLVCCPVETFETPMLDFTQPALGIELVPARPSMIPIRFIGIILVERLSGTQVTPAQIQAGSDAAHQNFIASSSAPATANVNGNTPPFFATGVLAPANTTRLIPGAPVIFDVVTGCVGTGGFSIMAKFVVVTYWMVAG